MDSDSDSERPKREKKQKKNKKVKDDNNEKKEKPRRPIDLNAIKNKAVRAKLYQKQKQEKKKEYREKRKRKREAEEAGEEVEKKIPRTLENSRVYDESVVMPDDEETIEEEKTDEMAEYFSGKMPNIILTTNVGPTPVRKRTKKY